MPNSSNCRGRVSLRLNRPRPSEQVQYKRDESHDQQQVDEPTRYVECQPSGNPNPDQDEKQNQKDKIPHHVW